MFKADNIEATSGVVEVSLRDAPPPSFLLWSHALLGNSETNSFSYMLALKLIFFIQVQDVHHVALKQMLRFIYTDECQEGALEEMADHLLVAAGKYQLGRLQVLCELQLIKSLQVRSYDAAA